MITKIEVDGFKSLSHFEMNLKKGVNILVGPNGSGKTNIILFFEFVAQLVKSPISRAVSSVGGAGAILKKIGKDRYQDSLSFKIYGCSQKSRSKKYVVYEYEAEVKTSFENDSIYFSKQAIRLKNSSKFRDNPDTKYYPTEWDADLYYENPENVKRVIKVINANEKKFKQLFFPIKTDESMDLAKKMEVYMSELNLENNTIIPILFSFFEIAESIIDDLIGGETFNIIPSKVKEPEDAASPPEIKRDGSGLATTLYAIKKSRPVERGKFIKISFGFGPPEKSFEPTSLEKVKKYLKLANNTISDLIVDNDAFDNKVLIKFSIKTGDYESILPLSAMSDGTLKWLSLTTAILTSTTIFSIEEPENFLHPWMQAAIADIMREHIEEKKKESFVLMTTHSESLLNSSRPEEIIIVGLKEGKTTAKRIEKIELLKEEISKSGFGLGHFYFSNSIQDV